MKYVKRTSSLFVLFCFTLMLYLEFFNHPPAADTLASNSDNTEQENIRAPHFHHLRLADDTPAEVDRALRSSNFSTRQESTNLNNSEVSSSTFKKGKEGGASIEPSKSSAVKTTENKEQENGAEVNNGTLKYVNDSDDARGVHQHAPFDWDAWVKNNNYVDIGTIWAYCDQPDPPIIGKVTLEKDTENGGLKYNLDMNATILEPLESGKIVFNVELDGVHFATKYYDVCEAAITWEWDVFQCPIRPGKLDFHYEKHIPAYLPSGEYYGESKTEDQFERTVVCGQMRIKL